MTNASRQWLSGLGSAFSTLAAQAVAYGKGLPQGMEWVAVAAFTVAAFVAGVYSPSKYKEKGKA